MKSGRQAGHRLRVVVIRAAVAVLGSVVPVATADAHVSVQPTQAPGKASQEYVVRVPTERDVPTVAVRMVFPQGFEVLRFHSAPGWQYEVERDAAGKITGVTWSGGRVGREEYETFSFMARAPNPGKYKLDAYQSYEGGEVVGWVDPAGARPAPHVTIVAAAGAPAAAEGADPFAAGGVSKEREPAALTPSPRPGLVLSGVSLAIALVSLVISLRGSRRSRA